MLKKIFLRIVNYPTDPATFVRINIFGILCTRHNFKFNVILNIATKIAIVLSFVIKPFP